MTSAAVAVVVAVVAAVVVAEVAVVTVGRGGAEGWCNALREHFSFELKIFSSEVKI